MGYFSNTVRNVYGNAYGTKGVGVAGSFMKNTLQNLPKKGSEALKQFAFGKPEDQYQQSLLSPGQQSLSQQRNRALNQSGNTSSYGTTGDYYRDLLSPNGQNYQDMAAPEIRNYQENIIPDIGEEYAGMGSGALSSSGFRNANLRAGADLSERLGSLRQQMRLQGSQGLQMQGQRGLNQESENILRPATGGFMEVYGNLAGKLLGNYAGGYMNKGMGGA